MYALPQNSVGEFAAKAISTLEKKEGSSLDWDVLDEEGRTPMMVAACHDNAYIIK
jgi:hypothetical protein